MRDSREFVGSTDVAVVGGGVAGLSVARELGQRGLSVTLIERGRAGAEASGAAAGMLAPQSEADRRDPFFELLCRSRDLYPSFAERLLAETGIDIELDRTGTLYLAFTGDDEAEIERRFAWQTRAGLPVERLAADEARAIEPHISPRVRLALRFPRDWQVENRRLVAALAASVEAHGVRVWTGTEVSALRIEGGRVRGVETSCGFLSAPVVVVAAGAWSSLLAVAAGVEAAHAEPALTHPGIEPVRGQMLCFDARPAIVRHVVYTPRGYIVPRRDGRLLAGSTTERTGYDKCVTASGMHAVTRHALEIAPAVGDLALVDAWAGLRPHAADGLPLLGASDECAGLFYATGHYRNGILLAPLTGELLAAMIVDGVRPPALDAVAPARLRRDCVGINEE